MASAQNTTIRWRVGWASSVTWVPTRKIQDPIVTIWSTPKKSSTDEWSVRSSSRSYSPCSLARITQSGRLAQNSTSSHCGTTVSTVVEVGTSRSATRNAVTSPTTSAKSNKRRISQPRLERHVGARVGA